MKAFHLVKANAGAAGIDQQSLKDFEKDLKGNLYKIWNRMSSGSYFPPPIKAVPITKKSGGIRMLGVPTVADRIAQMVVKLKFEPYVEKYFYPDSYGYRPNKSALEAVGITRKRCWEYDWVIEYDIKGLFDNIDHDLLMKAVRKHTDNKWIILYIERWLRAPMQRPDGSLQERTKGIPQGGVISPVLSNLFLHYVFDVWISKNYPTNPWCRYADDAVIHCKTEQESQQILAELERRYNMCGLELNSDKTKIIYCQDSNRQKEHHHTSFDFLGYTFRPRKVNSKSNKLFISFTAAVSNDAKKSMREKIRHYKWHLRSDLSLDEMARQFNPVMQGWINYYGCYQKSALAPIGKHFNNVLIKWAMRKYKTMRTSYVRAARYIEKTAKYRSKLFAHWVLGIRDVFT